MSLNIIYMYSRTIDGAQMNCSDVLVRLNRIFNLTRACERNIAVRPMERKISARITTVTPRLARAPAGIRWLAEWYFSRASTGNPISRLLPRRDLFAEKLEM